MGELGLFTKWLWALTAIGQASLLCLLIARRNVKAYPAFSVYIFMTLAQNGLMFVAIRGSGFSSLASWRVGWTTQCLVMGARAFAITELCQHALGRFRGVWVVARWLLVICGAAVLLCALMVANHQWLFRLNTAEMGFDLATASVIVALLLFARYYDIPMAGPLRALAIGLCLYSCVSVLNDAILQRWLNSYASLWNQFSMAAFLGCLLLWTWAFRHAAPHMVTSPMFVDGTVYMSTIPEVNWRLRSLNEQLLKFWPQGSSRT
jgi:hypothetical protein